MLSQLGAPIEVFALVVATILVVTAASILTGRQDAQYADAAFRSRETHASSPPAALSPTSPPTATSTSTKSATSTSVNTATPDILQGAKVRTPEEAITVALELAHGLGAETPRLVSVELQKIDDLPPTAGLVDDGWNPNDLVWVVQLDNDEFAIDSCEPPYEPTPWPTNGSGHSCGTAATAIFVIQAQDGTVIAMWLGLPASL